MADASNLSCRSGKRNACLTSLPKIDQSRLLRKTLDDDKSACQWFLQSPRFEHWRDSSTAEIIYLWARAGCGKTTIARYAISHLQSANTSVSPKASGFASQRCGAESPLVLYFFFSKTAQTEKNDTIIALGTLIHQFLSRDPELHDILQTQYDKNETKGNIVWTLELLWDVFAEMINRSTTSHHIYTIIDALDECNDEDAEDFVRELVLLVEQWQPSDPHNGVPHIIVTGRRQEHMMDSIAPSQDWEITREETRPDIKSLIKRSVGRLAHRRSLDKEIQTVISNFLERNAEGMFIWVVLVSKELALRNQPLTDESIAQKLRAVPGTLVSMYETILNDTPESRQKDLWRILRWLLYSKGSLSILQLQELLCSEVDIPNWYDFENDIEYVCRSLICIEADSVRLIHQTARDFLHHYIYDTSIKGTLGIELVSNLLSHYRHF